MLSVYCLRAFSAAVIITLAFSANAEVEQDWSWVKSLSWQAGPGNYPVDNAHAHFVMQAGEVGLFGSQAGQFMVRTEGTESFRNVDAVIVPTQGIFANSELAIAHADLGYVRDS